MASDVNNISRSKSYKRFSRSAAGPVGAVSIVIDKSDYELSVYDDKGWYATYPVVFGNNSLSDKKMQGDKNTPEGVFHINAKRVHDKWCRYLSIDYRKRGGHSLEYLQEVENEKYFVASWDADTESKEKVRADN